jgi:hypothetical protein
MLAQRIGGAGNSIGVTSFCAWVANRRDTYAVTEPLGWLSAYGAACPYAGSFFQMSSARAPTRTDWAPLTGQFDPKNWVRDVYESYFDRLVTDVAGFSHSHDWPADEAGVLEVVSVEVNDMLQGMLGFDEVGPNPVDLAQAVTKIIMGLRKRKR